MRWALWRSGREGRSPTYKSVATFSLKANILSHWFSLNLVGCPFSFSVFVKQVSTTLLIRLLNDVAHDPAHDVAHDLAYDGAHDVAHVLSRSWSNEPPWRCPQQFTAALYTPDIQKTATDILRPCPNAHTPHSQWCQSLEYACQSMRLAQ